jgi:hypothetical protein
VRDNQSLTSTDLQSLRKFIHEIHGTKTPAELEEEKRLRTVQTLSIEDRRKVVELSDFYKHISQIVENLIDKFSSQERLILNLQHQTQREPKETRKQSKTTLLPSIHSVKRPSNDPQ